MEPKEEISRVLVPAFTLHLDSFSYCIFSEFFPPLGIRFADPFWCPEVDLKIISAPGFTSLWLKPNEDLKQDAIEFCQTQLFLFVLLISTFLRR